jgi:hypothetical protein
VARVQTPVAASASIFRRERFEPQSKLALQETPEEGVLDGEEDDEVVDGIDEEP